MTDRNRRHCLKFRIYAFVKLWNIRLINRSARFACNNHGKLGTISKPPVNYTKQFASQAPVFLKLRSLKGSVFIGLTLSLASCTHSPPGNTILRLSGSDTIGQNLAPALIQSYFKIKENCEKIRDDKDKPTVTSEIHVICEKKGGEKINAVIKHEGTESGIPDVIIKKADIAMASHAVGGENKKMFDEHLIAKDAIAIIVHGDNNDVSSLDIEELRELFNTGQYTEKTSKQVRKMQIYRRDDKSGTYISFLDLVMKENKDTEPLTIHEKAIEANSNKEIISRVANDQNGIGFIGSSFTQGMNQRVKILGIGQPNNIRTYSPSIDGINNQRYPLHRELYLYVPTQPEKHILNFIQFVKSDGGQKVVAENGFVRLSFSPQCTGKDHIGYKGYTEGYCHRKTVRFKPDGRELNDLAIHEINSLKEQKSSFKKILVLGFTDDDGTSEYNVGLSKDRASAVLQKLKDLRNDEIIITSDGLGESYNIGDNATPAGQALNRRVELWSSQ